MVQNVDALLIVIYLLPGFIGLLVFESLAEIKRRQSPEKIGLIVLFSLLSMTITNIVISIDIVPNIDLMKNDRVQLYYFVSKNILYASISAVILGIIFAAAANYHIVYVIASHLRITRRTGSIDPWHQVFTRHRKIWVLIRFEDGSCLVGWPRYYSEEGELREIFLSQATWHFPCVQSDDQQLSPGDPSYREVDVDGDGVLISNFSKVKAVEILKGGNDGEDSTEKTTTGTIQTNA